MTNKNTKEETTSKSEFKKLVEAYKIQNPVKYEQKKAVLDKKLASL